MSLYNESIREGEENMAIQEQLDILKRGVKEWNTWRTQQKAKRITTSIDLSKADLSEATFSGANLSEANFSGADLSGADLSGADLSGSIFNGVGLSKVDLSNIDLSEANLSETNLSELDLRKVNLKGVNLSRADLSRANLSRVDLSGADFSRTNLSEANLSDANLSRANLIEANLSRVNLNRTDLSEATLGRTIFSDIDLRTVKGIKTIKHETYSAFATSTLARSQGDIPELFLRGVGVDDILMEHIRSLYAKAINYYTCFISYSSKDELFVRRLHNDLQQEGIRCWFAPEDMDIGDKIRHRIDESIRLYDKLLLILSEHSITSSWVAYEVERALKKEPQGIPNVLYPVRVDQTIMTCSEAWARDIKDSRHIGDFEHWTDPQQYEESFKRLLRALNMKKEQQKVEAFKQ